MIKEKAIETLQIEADAVKKLINHIDDEFESFWNNVYFANYVDGLCGIGDSKAKILIKNNKEIYNNELFEFINNILSLLIIILPMLNRLKILKVY